MFMAKFHMLKLVEFPCISRIIFVSGGPGFPTGSFGGSPSGPGKSYSALLASLDKKIV